MATEVHSSYGFAACSNTPRCGLNWCSEYFARNEFAGTISAVVGVGSNNFNLRKIPRSGDSSVLPNSRVIANSMVAACDREYM
jgi:hypothetical protein